MDKNLFTDIDIYLTVERQYSRMSDDRFLRDYSAPFKHMTDDWHVPPDQANRYFALARKEQERKDNGKYPYNWGGTISVDEMGGVHIGKGAGGGIYISAANRAEFLRDLASQPAKGPHPGVAPGQTVAGGQTSANIGGNHLENDDRAGMKERMERALKEMEKIGQPMYPRHG